MDVLKAANLDIMHMIVSRSVPLLMYADDIVILVSGVSELARINVIVTKFV